MAETASSELNLRELRILNALLHERSITRTAQLLSTTQPGIQQGAAASPRAQFADPLFVRNGHAMQPTAKALEISDQLRALLGAADSLRAAATAFDPAQSDRTLQPFADRRRDDPVPAAADCPGRRHRPEGWYPGDAAGFPAVRVEAGGRRSGFGAWRFSGRSSPPPPAAAVFRRLCDCRAQRPSKKFDPAVPHRLSLPSGIFSSRHQRPVTPRM